MNSLSDSFYLIVSTDEKYIYGSIENQTHAGNKFRPIKDYTIKDIVNSKYISYEQAERPIEWSKSTLKNGANVTMTQIELANNILKYNPKIITMDLILNKRDDNFPMMESEMDDFNWLDEVRPTLGVAFEEGLIKKGDVLTLSGRLTDEFGRSPIQVSDFKIKIETIQGPDNIYKDITHSFFIPLQEKYFEHLGYNESEPGDSIRFANTDGELEVLDIS